MTGHQLTSNVRTANNIIHQHGLPDPEGISAFVSVNVVDLEQGTIHPHQTVLIHRHTIVKVGDTSTVDVPANAEILTGSLNKELFLMPGMADMHTHLKVSDITHDEYQNLLLYLVNGVTTILSMGDFSGIPPQLQQQVVDGACHGPTIYTSKFVMGPTDGGASEVCASNPAEGRELVNLARAQGYDFIKVYNGITTETFDTVVEHAHSLGMAVIGHGVREPGMQYIIENGIQMIAHAEEFYYTYFHRTIDMSRTPALITLLLKNDVYVTPTFVTFTGIADFWDAPNKGKTAREVFTSKEGSEFLAEERIDSWQEVFNMGYAGRECNLYPILEFQQAFIEAFDKSGVKLLLGTDSPYVPGVAPGFSLHHELELCTQAHMAPVRSLQACTVNADAFIHKHLKSPERFGHIKPGYRADLVLLRENPLADVKNTRTIQGVMSRGRWYSQTAINELLATFKRSDVLS